MKIYTRTGDQGETALFGGGRVSKADLRVAAYGAVDELNAALGLARAAAPCRQIQAWLEELQNQLFHLGAELATPPGKLSRQIARIQAHHVQWLEATIDEMDGALPALRNFILPGGTGAAAQLQLARAICRRAERDITLLATQESIGDMPLVYINRLSDWLFTAARYDNLLAGEAESKWSLRDAPH